jgi:hypothetical protein
VSNERNATDWLMSGGVPWAKFDDFGDTVTGTITEEPRVRQSRDYDSNEPAFWPDGGAVEELVITLQTDQRDPEADDDDGRRLFVVNAPAKKNALRDAVRNAGAKGLAVGGRLQVTFTHELEPKKRGARGAKQYAARYAPPPPREVPVDGGRREAPRGRHEPFDPRPARSREWAEREAARPEPSSAPPWDRPAQARPEREDSGWTPVQTREGDPWAEKAPAASPPADDPWQNPAPSSSPVRGEEPLPYDEPPF